MAVLGDDAFSATPGSIADWMVATGMSRRSAAGIGQSCAGSGMALCPRGAEQVEHPGAARICDWGRHAHVMAMRHRSERSPDVVDQPVWILRHERDGPGAVGARCQGWAVPTPWPCRKIHDVADGFCSFQESLICFAPFLAECGTSRRRTGFLFDVCSVLFPKAFTSAGHDGADALISPLGENSA